MLIALKTWAFAHLLVNGDVASMLLFGAFLAWAVVDLVAVRRGGRSAVVAAPQARFDILAAGVGLALSALVVWRLHAYLAGVALVAG